MRSTKVTLADYSSFSSLLKNGLERLAELHSRAKLDIKPELYDLWLDWLVLAVKEFDPMFDLQIETAWRRMLQPGIEFMKSRY